MNRLPALLVFVTAAAWSQTPEFSINGVRHAWYVVPTGGDVSLTAAPWQLVAGAGLDQPDFGRSSTTGDLRPEDDPYLKPLLPNVEVGLLAVWSPEWAHTWAGVVVTGYKVWDGSAAAFSDWQGNVYGSLTAGARRDRVTSNDHGLESGYTVEATAEWSPSAASFRGTDYYRFGIRSSYLLPLWDLPGEAQVFSGQLAFRADAQYTGGRQVPIIRLEPTEVRGYDNTFDARALTVGSVELRGRLPSWWKTHDVVPVGFVFFDAGTYSGFADSATNADKSGFLAGTGIGGGLELFGKAAPTLTLGVPLVGVKKTLWWDLGFHLAF